jgi:energy-coupling factor transporter ATP-binding protein EcfA2
VKVGAQNWYIQKVIKIPESGPSQYTDNRTASGQQGVLPPIDTILDPSNSPSSHCDTAGALSVAQGNLPLEDLLWVGPLEQYTKAFASEDTSNMQSHTQANSLSRGSSRLLLVPSDMRAGMPLDTSQTLSPDSVFQPFNPSNYMREVQEILQDSASLQFGLSNYMHTGEVPQNASRTLLQDSTFQPFNPSNYMREVQEISQDPSQSLLQDSASLQFGLSNYMHTGEVPQNATRTLLQDSTFQPFNPSNYMREVQEIFQNPSQSLLQDSVSLQFGLSNYMQTEEEPQDASRILLQESTFQPFNPSNYMREV